MRREKIIEAFADLGNFMNQFEHVDSSKKDLALNEFFYDTFNSLIPTLKSHNGWFDELQVRKSITALSFWLDYEALNTWLSYYSWSSSPKKVAIIMAGNIPLVGFHDFVCGLVSGHHLLIKMSSDDKVLLPFIVKILVHINSDFEGRITFTDSKMTDFDAVIATGSDNSARYFAHYFGKYPHLIRKNRNSVAVLSGNESKEDLRALGKDVFDYYGLGCRNVSKIYVPKDYKFELLFEAFYEYKFVMDNKKYANNFDYHRALFLMGGHDLLENGFLLLKEDESLSSPISVLYYETYDSISELEKTLHSMSEQIQCVVSELNIPNSFRLGASQQPSLTDYADGEDTMAFLMSL